MWSSETNTGFQRPLKSQEVLKGPSKPQKLQKRPYQSFKLFKAAPNYSEWAPKFQQKQLNGLKIDFQANVS